MQEQPKVEGSTSDKHESSIHSEDDTLSLDDQLIEHDRWLKWMKTVVAVSLVVSALTLTLSVFYKTKENEDDKFENQVR